MRTREGGNEKEDAVPDVKKNLVSLSIRSCIVLEIKDGVSALICRQGFHKAIVVSRLDGLFDDNFLVIVADAKSDVFVLLLQLQVLKGLDGNIMDTDSGRLHFEKDALITKGISAPISLPIPSEFSN